MENRCILNDKGPNGEDVKAKDMYGFDKYCYDGFPCENNLECKYWGNPDFGVLSFDNILNSLLIIFIVITLKGWTAIMY